MRVEALSPSDREDVIDVLVASFWDYPVMRYALSDSGEAFEDHLRALTGFFCDARYSRNWPVLGIRDGGTLAAVMLLSEPVVTPRPVDLQAAYHALSARIGQAALDRMNRYEELSSRLEPDVPHYFVGMLGTLPEYQGRGMGKTLLAHVAERAEADDLARGVCLATEDPRNVPYYEAAGYRVLGRVQVDTIESWCMWRPNLGDG